MVEKKVYTPEFQRMVVKAYYTSDKSILTLAKSLKSRPLRFINGLSITRKIFQAKLLFAMK